MIASGLWGGLYDHVNRWNVVDDVPQMVKDVPWRSVPRTHGCRLSLPNSLTSPEPHRCGRLGLWVGKCIARVGSSSISMAPLPPSGADVSTASPWSSTGRGCRPHSEVNTSKDSPWAMPSSWRPRGPWTGKHLYGGLPGTGPLRSSGQLHPISPALRRWRSCRCPHHTRCRVKNLTQV